MRKSSRALAPLVLALLSLAAAAGDTRAQIVNVQSALATDPRPGPSGSVTASADWRTGNSKLLLLGLAPIGRLRLGDHLVVAILRGEYGQSGEVDIVRKAFEHLRYRYRLRPRVVAEAFQQAEYDRFRLLELRALVGVGPKLDLIARKRLSLSLGVAYLLELERPSAGAQETGQQLSHRGSSYLMAQLSLDDRVQVVETVYAQPKITDPHDIRLLNESQLVVQLGKALSLTTSLALAFDSQPLHFDDGTRLARLDTTTKTSITVSF
jgi:hypothetical protein